jgi:hypothetical protein
VSFDELFGLKGELGVITGAGGAVWCHVPCSGGSRRERWAWLSTWARTRLPALTKLP